MVVASAGLVESQSVSGVENLLARSSMYQILSGCFLYPLGENLSVLKGMEFTELKKSLVRCYEGIDGGKELQWCLDEVQNSYSDTDIGTLQRIFQAVVGHTISKECPLYETQYGAAHVYQQVHELGDIQGFYKAFGLDISDVEKERSDHVSVELEFMHFLLYKQAYAIENDGDDKAAICVEAQKKFLKDHIGKWVPLFAILFGKKVEDGFYYSLSLLTKEFLRLEMMLMGVQTEMFKESDLNQDMVAGAPDECLSCASSEDLEGV